VEHALQLETTHLRFEGLRVPFDVGRCALVVLALGEIEQLRGVGNAFGRAIELADLRRQPGAFAPQLLRTLGFRPDRGVFQLAADLLQALFLEIVFKETPEGSRCAPRGL
jgi:hypothetical protein